MKKKIFSIIAAVFCLTVVMSICSFAANYPSISKDKYIEFKAQENINVYKDTACKTRGTSSPSKKYNASIATGDTCYIYKIENNYIEINYPTSSGRRSGYIKRASLFDKTAPVSYISSSKAKVNIHKSSSGSYVAKGDKVWHVDPKKGYSGYKAVIYEAKSGKRAYKMGYVTENDLKKIKGENVTVTTQTKKISRVDVFNSYFGSNLLSSIEGNRRFAKNCIDVAVSVETTLAIEKTLGTSIGAVAYLDPKKMLGVLDLDSMMGLASLLASKSIYDSGEAYYTEFLKKSKNVKTAAQADAAVKCGIEALAHYKAIISEYEDLIERYSGKWAKHNWTLDKLEAFLSSVCDSLVPASTESKLLTACKVSNTFATVINTAADVQAYNSGAKSARDYWNNQWNELISIGKNQK